MRKLNKEQQDFWDSLRFGNLHPKLIRHELYRLLRKDMNKWQFSYEEDEGEKVAYNSIWIPPISNNKFWEDLEDTNNLYDFGISYNKSFHNWVYDQSKFCDVDIAIGWCPIDEEPTIIISNMHHDCDDFVKYGPGNNKDVKSIAKEFYDVIHYVLLDTWYSSKIEDINERLKSDWISK